MIQLILCVPKYSLEILLCMLHNDAPTTSPYYIAGRKKNTTDTTIAKVIIFAECTISCLTEFDQDCLFQIHDVEISQMIC